MAYAQNITGKLGNFSTPKDRAIDLLITMYDEHDCVMQTISNPFFCGIYVAHSDDGRDFDGSVFFYDKQPNIAKGAHPKAVPALSLVRNFNILFREWATDQNASRWGVFITGDTLIEHVEGINKIITALEFYDGTIACAKAFWQNFHNANLTPQDFDSGTHGGRIQYPGISDFMPQMFIVDRWQLAGRRQPILKATNLWCSEQCLGDAFDAPTQMVFAENAYDFSDGVKYHAST